VEDRLETDYTERPGTALIALAVILAVTAAWWALALWPAGAAEPEWLARTRLACFGSVRGGLPDAGGWILLIGEPIGMFGALIALWGRSLWRDLRWLTAKQAGPVIVAAVLLATAAGVASAAVRVTRELSAGSNTALEGATRIRVNRPAPAFTLVDQHGRRTSLSDFRGTRTLVTFAFGHCETVCPAVVTQLQEARRRGTYEGVPIIVITLDPWRDTPERLPSLARQWQLAENDRVLSGPVPDVQAALDSLGVGRQRNSDTGDVIHPATVMFIDRDGLISWRTEGG
jgi:cytochrome oxidase Cu insertion factor (SCO1/SenC/PrrC family)